MVMLPDFDVFLKSVFCLPAEQEMLRSRCVIAATLRIAATLSRIPVGLGIFRGFAEFRGILLNSVQILIDLFLSFPQNFESLFYGH